jgi:hypothetical protein
MHIVHLSNKIILELHRDGMRRQLDQMGFSSANSTTLCKLPEMPS